MIVLVAGATANTTDVTRHLWLRGFDAFEAESPGIGAALEALEVADAVVVELDDPDFPATHLIDRLKTAAPDMPVIALGGDDKAAAAYLAGADAIFGVDVDPTELAGELHRMQPALVAG